jgi:Tol biopolymer transport system component
MTRFQACFGAVMLFTAIPRGAGQVPLIRRQVLFGNAEKLRPQVSPNGKLLAYIAPYQGVRNVWVRTIGASDDRAVTRETVRPIRDYYWQPDNSHILYQHDDSGNEDFHIYRTDLHAEKTEDLTPFEKISASVLRSGSAASR